MTSPATVRGFLRNLANHLDSTLDTELMQDPERLVVRSSDDAAVEVELTTPITSTGVHVVYSHVRTGQVYGDIANVPAAAERLHQDLREGPNHAK